jgi:membrane protease YdiL (CAAX protease family)
MAFVISRASEVSNGPQERAITRWVSASVSYAVLLTAFWFAAQFSNLESRIGGHLPSTFASFALLLAPYWAFGFGIPQQLGILWRSRRVRVLAPGLVVVAYIVFAWPRGELLAAYAITLGGIPIALAALFEFVPPRTAALSWQDAVVLIAAGTPVEFGWLQGTWAHPGLHAVPKLLLVDAILYAFLVVRRTPGVGYDFRPRWRDLMIGLREWGLFAPLALALGFALHFLRFSPQPPSGLSIASGWLVTFFLVAVPEELFFRGLLQNLLERRLEPRRSDNSGRAPWRSLLIASALFGLSHFNKPLPFNWRYVLLAALAGIFYGRAWRDRRRLFASSITHATVDVVWAAWFRA